MSIINSKNPAVQSLQKQWQSDQANAPKSLINALPGEEGPLSTSLLNKSQDSSLVTSQILRNYEAKQKAAKEETNTPQDSFQKSSKRTIKPYQYDDPLARLKNKPSKHDHINILERLKGTKDTADEGQKSATSPNSPKSKYVNILERLNPKSVNVVA